MVLPTKKWLQNRLVTRTTPTKNAASDSSEISNWQVYWKLPNWAIWLQVPVRPIDINCNLIWLVNFDAIQSLIVWKEIRFHGHMYVLVAPPRAERQWQVRTIFWKHHNLFVSNIYCYPNIHNAFLAIIIECIFAISQ